MSPQKAESLLGCLSMTPVATFETWKNITQIILFSKMLKFSQEKLQRTKFCEREI
jgi:hypothetical protein